MRLWTYGEADNKVRLDTDNLEKVCCAVNSEFNEVTWYYPSASGGTGEIDKYVKYNIEEKSWDYGTMPRSAWTDQSVLGQPIGCTPNALPETPFPGCCVMNRRVGTGAGGAVTVKLADVARVSPELGALSVFAPVVPVGGMMDEKVATPLTATADVPV